MWEKKAKLQFLKSWYFNIHKNIQDHVHVFVLFWFFLFVLMIYGVCSILDNSKDILSNITMSTKATIEIWLLDKSNDPRWFYVAIGSLLFSKNDILLILTRIWVCYEGCMFCFGLFDAKSLHETRHVAAVLGNMMSWTDRIAFCFLSS